jgi:hypothetical protein
MLSILVSANLAFAGTTGKVAGLVIDKATGEGLAGVNIFFKNTNIGAASDLDGYYRIINVPPGTYTLSVSMIGYSSVTVEDIKIQSDRTTTQNITLASETLEMDAVVIVADRPLVEHDRTNGKPPVVIN